MYADVAKISATYASTDVYRSPVMMFFILSLPGMLYIGSIVLSSSIEDSTSVEENGLLLRTIHFAIFRSRSIDLGLSGAQPFFFS